jgi:hypothetical protein
MRILWAFEIKWAPGTKQPLDPLTYMRHSEMPGNASSRLPVTLRILCQEKAEIINQTFEVLQQERLPLVGATLDERLLIPTDVANLFRPVCPENNIFRDQIRQRQHIWTALRSLGRNYDMCYSNFRFTKYLKSSRY